MNGARWSCLVAAACLACGARTPLSTEALAASDAATSSDSSSTAVTLTIPLGTYSGCTSGTITTRPNFVGATGGTGSITLTREGDRVVATLGLARYASGRLAFVPTTRSSAAFAASQGFDVQIANPTFSVATVTATTGALSIVRQTLFVSTHGSAGSDDVSTFFHCRVPAGVAPTDIVTSAPPPGQLAAGVYRSCVASSSTDGPIQAGLSGGVGSLTVTRDGGTFRLTWPDSLQPHWACGGLDFGADPLNASVRAGQSCDITSPCGPPPTLGMSPFPNTATLTGLQGSMMVSGDVLFVDVLGDAPDRACGVHDLSITCAGPSTP
jgi:hypothetical protein